MTETWLYRVPAGCSSGDLISVTADGAEFTVLCPDGLISGDMMEVSLPVDTSRLPSVDVELPPGVIPGDELFLEHEGCSFSFLVPDEHLWRRGVGRRGSHEVEVELPELLPPSTESSGDWSDELAEMEGHAHGLASDCESERSGRSHIPSAARPPSRSTAFSVGEEVEVLRSNGGRTHGTVDAADFESGTYTVRMLDGRVKYLVDEEDLRHYRAGAYHVGDQVTMRLQPQCIAQPARITGFDDTSNTYSLVCLDDGKRVAFVLDEEIETARRKRW